MSVVKINALQVPAEMGPMLEQRFAARAGDLDKMPGFEGFELLRPTDDSGRYFVYTRWADEESFQNWRSSQEFDKGHAQTTRGGPVSTGAELLEFEVVITA